MITIGQHKTCECGNHYIGSELTLFSSAVNWRSYVAHLLRPHVHGRVLEVGAGMGNNIPHLLGPSVTNWLAMEPDPDYAAIIDRKIAGKRLPPSCQVMSGTLDVLDPTELFDTILYFDVLEHIADDAAELRRAACHLKPRGKLIVLAPAHQFLFSPFDTAIGHYRRYNARSLRAIGPSELQVGVCRMLDSVGFFASLANRIMLRAAHPTRKQIRFWDTVLVPLSRVIDPRIGYLFGKSVAIVWARPDNPDE